MITLRKLFFLLAALVTGAAYIHAANPILDLAGEWDFALDRGDVKLNTEPVTCNFTDTIQLPGTTALQSKGEPLKIELNL